MIKSVILSIFFLVITTYRIQSQQSNTLFFMHSVPQSNFINPAIQGECRWFIGLPVISSTHLNLAHNGFTINHLLEIQGEDQYSLDAEKIDRKLNGLVNSLRGTKGRIIAKGNNAYDT